MDETIDSKHRCITNVIIGALRTDKASTGQLIKCIEVMTVNAENMAVYVISSLNQFWPGGFDPEFFYI